MQVGTLGGMCCRIRGKKGNGREGGGRAHHLVGCFYEYTLSSPPSSLSSPPSSLFSFPNSFSPLSISLCYGEATISRLPKNIGLFCKRALYKRLYSAKDTYIFKKPTIHSHPICYACRHFLVCVRARTLRLSLANAQTRSLSFPSLSRSLLLAGFPSGALSLSLTLSHSQARTPIHSLSIFF